MGYNDSDDYLNYYITELIGSTGSGGIFADIVVNEQEAVDGLYDKEDTLQDRLTSIQNNYITQYSALNAGCAVSIRFIPRYFIPKVRVTLDRQQKSPHLQ